MLNAAPGVNVTLITGAVELLLLLLPHPVNESAKATTNIPDNHFIAGKPPC
jgi:hypothetical protein